MNPLRPLCTDKTRTRSNPTIVSYNASDVIFNNASTVIFNNASAVIFYNTDNRQVQV
jgi:hypothetical protein